MSRRKSEFVSAAGTTLEVIKALSDAVGSLGGGDEHLRELISNRKLAQQVAELLVANTSSDTFHLTIDYSLSLDEMIAAGRYGFLNQHITSGQFQVGSGESSVEAVLVNLNRSASDEEVVVEIFRRGLRPATLVELLALGAQHPEVLQTYRVVALGSGSEEFNATFAPYLWSTPLYRGIDLRVLGSSWNRNYRFLAVRR